MFVDSSAFYAAVDEGDQAHARAVRALASGELLVTTDHVLAESWSLIEGRMGWHVAERFWGEIRGGGASIELVTPADLEAAWAIGERFADQEFSLVDRTSFAAMQRLGVHRVASFDRDFAIFRFGPRRDRAFEIVA
jgi:predicted nucleic acid-binding protein